TTTSTAPKAAATLVLSSNSGRPGDRIHVHACGFQPGAPVDVTFDGQVIGHATADANGCVDLDVIIPNVPPGQYQLCVMSAGVAPQCTTFTVLGEGFSRGGGPLPFTGGGGPLAFTGLHLAELVAIALVAIVGGRVLMRSR